MIDTTRLKQKLILVSSVILLASMNSVIGYYFLTPVRFPTYLDRNQYTRLPIGVATWCYSAYSDSALEIITQCDRYNITTLIVSADPGRLTVGNARYNATYAANIYQLLVLAESHDITIHFMTCESSAFWNPVTYTSAANLIGLFLNYSRTIAPISFAGLHIDVEYYGEKTSPAWNWDDFWANKHNASNYMISNGFMNLSRVLSGLIKAHNQKYADDLQFSAAMAYFQHDAAMKGLINGTYTQLKEYYDFLVPMHAELKLRPDQLKESMKDELEIMPVAIGMGSIDYTDFGKLARDLNILTWECRSSTNYNGFCMYSYEYLITLSLKQSSAR